MAGRRRPHPFVEVMSVEKTLGELARRTNELFVGLARLDARVADLEKMLDAVREECAKLVRQAVKARLTAKRRPRAPRLPRLRSLASVEVTGDTGSVNGHAPTSPRPVRLIA